MEKELLFKNRVLELSQLAYDRNIVTFTDFMDLNELHIINSLRTAGITRKMYGGYEMSERQIAAFIPDALSYEWTYPIQCIFIKPCSLKFSEPLTHRDYLGALLNLGIERSVIGDILVQDNCAYVCCLEGMSDFLVQHLIKVRHTSVTAERISSLEKVFTPSFETITGTVASIRLDAMIGLAFHTSRSSMTGLIEGGKVFVNGKMVVSNGYTLKENDIISARGYGKFQFCNACSQTKKGRYRVVLNLYV